MPEAVASSAPPFHFSCSERARSARLKPTSSAVGLLETPASMPRGGSPPKPTPAATSVSSTAHDHPTHRNLTVLLCMLFSFFLACSFSGAAVAATLTSPCRHFDLTTPLIGRNLHEGRI